MTTREEIQLTEEQLRLAELLGVTKEAYIEILKLQRELEEDSIPRMQRRIEKAA